MMVSGMGSGTSSRVSGGGIDTDMRALAASRSDGLAGCPSTVTSPWSMSLRTWLRDSSRQRRAMKESRRSPARSTVRSRVFMDGPLRPRPEEDVAEKDHGDTYGYGGIGDVE